jgi:hypothetical protein
MREHQKVIVNILSGISITIIPTSIFVVYFGKISIVKAAGFMALGFAFAIIATVMAYIFGRR